MKYEILDNEGKVIQTIIADYAFVEKHHPGRFEEVVAEPIPIGPEIEPEVEPDRFAEINVKLDKIIKDIATIKIP